jgi:hypothetical protein
MAKTEGNEIFAHFYYWFEIIFTISIFRCTRNRLKNQIKDPPKPKHAKTNPTDHSLRRLGGGDFVGDDCFGVGVVLVHVIVSISFQHSTQYTGISALPFFCSRQMPIISSNASPSAFTSTRLQLHDTFTTSIHSSGSTPNAPLRIHFRHSLLANRELGDGCNTKRTLNDLTASTRPTCAARSGCALEENY